MVVEGKERERETVTEGEDSKSTTACCGFCKKFLITRSSWFICALRDDEAVYWVSIGHYEAVAVGN